MSRGESRQAGPSDVPDGRSRLSGATLRKGATFSTLSAISYATGVVFIRFAYGTGLSPGTAIFLRFAIATLALALFLTLARRWIKLPRSQVVALFLLGLLGYTGLGVTWFVALSMTPAWLVSLFVALYPLLTNLAGWLFLGEAIDRQKGLALILVLAGSAALFWRPFEAKALAGVWLMVLNVVIQTVYILVGDRWTRGVPPVISTTWMAVGAMLGTFLYACIAGELAFDFAPAGWGWATLFAIISTAFAIMFFWWGVGLLGPSRATIIGALEPLFSILLSVLVLGESMSALQVFGGVLVLTGALVVRIQGQRARRGREVEA